MLDLILLIIALANGAPDSAGPPASASSAEALPAGEATLPPPAASGADADPAHEAEQQVATGRFTTALEVRPILSATRANWIAVRDFDGQDLVYVTQIWSWRCGLMGLRIGINGAAPRPWPLPDCHEDSNSPNAILPADGLPYRAFPQGSVQTVTVELVYDDLGTERVTFNRHGALLP